MSPVLEIEPVDLDGITVSNVNAFNYATIEEQGVGIGSEIVFEKSGDIVPNLIRTVSKSDKKVYPDVAFYMKGRNAFSLDEVESIKHKFTLGFKTLNIDNIGEVNMLR